MELSNSHAIQLIVGLILGLTVFVLSFTVSPKKILAVLVVLIPFQLVSSRYGSLNMVLIYQVFFCFLISSRIKHWPLLLCVASLFFVYFLSTIFAPRGTWFDHSLYLITIGSNFVLFYITYNLFIKYPDVKFALRCLIVMNMIAIAYSLVLYFVGFEKIAFLGISEWSLNQNLEEKSRLMGPFNAAGVTAAFFASQILFLLYAAIFTERGPIKYLCYMMILINFALVVASGSRGSFLSLVVLLPVFMFMLKSSIGVIKVTKLTTLGILGFFTLSLYIVTQTNFDVLFERLYNTKVNAAGVPDTRQSAFDLTMKRINEKILFGHGPRILLIDEETRRVENYKPLGFFPHNLILFLIYTIGLFGMITYGVYFVLLFCSLIRAKRNKHPDKAIKFIPVLGIIYMMLFFLDQLKIEYLRFMFSDYQHYIFYLIGMLTALAKVASTKIKDL